MSRRLTLVLGGARSGKSHHAEQLALQCAGPVTYIATAREGDEEMQLRIALHRARRPEQWRLVEEPAHLAEALYTHAQHGGCVLVDCVTLWLNNLLFADQHAYPDTGPITPPAAWSAEIEAWLGVVPMGAVTRFYVDELGRLNQRLAALADSVHMLVAGIPLVVKGPAITPHA
jgi:adenosylcobinamide kinase/adenosylcobinamide-phosphate guanylyltransferase